MDHLPHAHTPPSSPPSFWRSRRGLGFIAFGALAAYYLYTEHLAHVQGALPLLLLLSCPLMHVFMHHGHGHGQHDPTETTKDKQGENP